MATIDYSHGQIRDRAVGMPQIVYSLGNKSKTFLQAALKAHTAIIEVMPPSVRARLTNTSMKATTQAYLALDAQSRKDFLSRLVLDYFSVYNPSSTGTPLDTLLTAWIAEKTASGATPTMRQIMSRHQSVFTAFFAEKKLLSSADLSPQTASDFLAWRSTTSFSSHSEAKVSSASTLRHELQSLRQIARIAYRNGWIADGHLWDDIQIRSIVGQNTKAVSPLSPADQTDILAALNTPGREGMHDAVLLLLVTGMRVGELDHLTPISITSGALHLHGHSVGNAKPTTGKTASAQRILPLCPTIQKIFERGYIFHYKSSMVKRNMGRGWFQIRWPHVHAHALRHTFAVNKLLSGAADIKMVQYQLGHADISTTANLYGKFEPEFFKVGFEQIKKERLALLNWLENEYF